MTLIEAQAAVKKSGQFVDADKTGDSYILTFDERTEGARGGVFHHYRTLTVPADIYQQLKGDL